MKKTMQRLPLTLLTVCVLAVMLVVGVFAVDHSVTVNIPVSCTGAPCTVRLSDAAGGQVQEKDAPATFEITVSDLGNYEYVLRVVNEDTADITYDKTVYHVNVSVFTNESDDWFPAIEADPIGLVNDDGKPEAFEFHNTDNRPSPAPSPTPTPSTSPAPTVTPAPSATPSPGSEVTPAPSSGPSEETLSGSPQTGNTHWSKILLAVLIALVAAAACVGGRILYKNRQH